MIQSVQGIQSVLPAALSMEVLGANSAASSPAKQQKIDVAEDFPAVTQSPSKEREEQCSKPFGVF